MIGDMEPAPQWGPPVPVPDLSTVEPTDVQECPVCYQEYNPYNKCPRILECLHVFCSECLQRIQLCPFDPADPHSPEAIPCPLCRHLTLPYGPAPGLVGEEEVIAPEQEDGPLRAALAVIFWVLFVITCVVAGGVWATFF
uniref:Si:ch73-335l21.2 n=1 Tax=Gouania willdenowi TaxID=441366 RepID=A0A8C5EUI5_GOUWI